MEFRLLLFAEIGHDGVEVALVHEHSGSKARDIDVPTGTKLNILFSTTLAGGGDSGGL